MSKEERHAYDAHLEALRYQQSVIETGLIEGEAKGRAEGKAEGLVEGRAEGLVEGRAEGLVEGKVEEQKKIVINGHKAGLPAETISTITGLTLDEVNKILKQS
jgi:flagellar biosynthesis/type III secretory pathway protein FliH